MSVPIQTVAEVTRRARNALIQELGVVDTLRFLNQFRAGSGDYATEREKLFKGESVKSIVAVLRPRETPMPNKANSAESKSYAPPSSTLRFWAG